jgi:hypothetical protein
VDDPSCRGPRLKVSLKFRERDDVPGLAQLMGFVALDAPTLNCPARWNVARRELLDTLRKFGYLLTGCHSGSSLTPLSAPSEDVSLPSLAGLGTRLVVPS